MAWVLFLLVAAVVIGVFIWDYRRKAARREAASKERFEQIFKGRAPAAQPPEYTAVAPAAVPPAATGAAPKTPVVAAVPARERFLGEAEARVFHLLKAGVPGCEVFANVTLASVVGVPDSVTGSAREQQQRRLAQYRIDFVVCDKDLRVIAAVELDSAQAADAAGVQRFKADSLKAAGIRLVRVHPSAPPRHEDIRLLLYGPGV